ncbi:hypothetical protein [Bacillus cereus]|uniref:Uncharacterized protein n=1 Tax=Bacillus cereus VD184 TaxID=1053242 RepID=A0A9W5VPP5_BACCE|nr:hypothetical protein [Bacillus cereus]EOQ01467.1 hypothetical protein IKC_06244 [Bacillus cereus VD184]
MKMKVVAVLTVLGVMGLWGGNISSSEHEAIQQKQIEIKYMFNDPGTS